MTLEQVLNLIAGVFTHAGAHHVSVGAVSHHLGWLLTKHWLIKVCFRGSLGCNF